MLIDKKQNGPEKKVTLKRKQYTTSI
jgi:hypothetical protein